MSRFIPSGKTKIGVGAFVDPTTPTRSEITACVTIAAPGLTGTEGIESTDGFYQDPQFIATADINSKRSAMVEGRESDETVTINVYDDDAVTVIRTALAKGTTTFVYVMRYGDVPTKKMDIFRVKSLNIKPMNPTSAATVATATIQLSMESDPYRDITIPAAA